MRTNSLFIVTNFINGRIRTYDMFVSSIAKAFVNLIINLVYARRVVGIVAFMLSKCIHGEACVFTR